MKNTSTSIDDSQYRYTKEEIQQYLDNTFSCIRAKLYTVATDPTTRPQNDLFKRIYDIEQEDYEEMFLSLTTDNFAYTLQNKKPGFQHEVLYVFRLDTMLFNVTNFEYDDLTIYIKINFEQTPRLYCTYISCHEADVEKPLEYYDFNV